MSLRFTTQKTLEKLQQKAQKTIQRSLDQHIKLAVTGFSGSGKTALITALVKHLTTQANSQNLPFFDVVRDHRLIACKLVPQKALDIPTFDYHSAAACLLAEDPRWPPSTERINTLTLALKFRSRSGIRQHFSDDHTIYLELIDYPGEWLMDLPMLNMNFEQWSRSQLDVLSQSAYSQYSEPLLAQLDKFDATAQVDSSALNMLSESYCTLLKTLKRETKVAKLQPGRMLIPGDLAGAPIIQFFPLPNHDLVEKAGTQYEQLAQRFEAYKKQVIEPFYKEYFCAFDRQLVLVDLIGALNDGPATLVQTQQALRETMGMFKHGKSGVLQRLFRPKIDKVLFAANKCDAVAITEQDNLTRLLHELLCEHENELKFAGVEVDTMTISSVKSCQHKQVQDQGKTLNCVYGKPLNESQFITFLPPEPPDHVLSSSNWPDQGFEFLSFYPMPAYQGQLEHIRLDHTLQFLIGDKLR
ncbi:nucleoside triphosphate hydrolase [Pseudoalteromonas luteoviolacea]|uniref:Nucleoside triphosphate hydrolase n=1 Tax=Pseudoalteromonas luteoviolacea TaxID=43657 RepID=A0A1C0TKJ7_9GAMM|nr:YcjX family protein [Pseudoalteromonas luteoviolacea]OCQ18901.1 nucleoside triphosphate hydrolase [Pseudoalteromonas luteoviolacea]